MGKQRARSHKRQRQHTEADARQFHAKLVQWFYNRVDYNAETHEWSEATQQAADYVKRKWTAYATKRNFSRRLTRSMMAAVKLIQVDLMLESKYGAKADRQLVVDIIGANPAIEANEICIEILKSNQYALS